MFRFSVGVRDVFSPKSFCGLWSCPAFVFKRYWGIFRQLSVKLFTQLHLLTRLRLSGAPQPLSLTRVYFLQSLPTDSGADPAFVLGIFSQLGVKLITLLRLLSRLKLSGPHQPLSLSRVQEQLCLSPCPGLSLVFCVSFVHFNLINLYTRISYHTCFMYYQHCILSDVLK
jgi:hypothetical protein